MSAGLYKDRQAAQVAAFFLYKAGGTLSILKLMKLMYLAERLSLERYGIPLTGDSLVSMPHGPVLSMTLNYINGLLESSPGGWNEWIAAKENHNLSLADPSMIRTPEQDLSALSETDVEVLTETWEKFGHMSGWQLRNYTHEHLPEWSDPKGSSLPITYRKLFQVLGFSKEDTEILTRRIEEQQEINEAFNEELM